LKYVHLNNGHILWAERPSTCMRIEGSGNVQEWTSVFSYVSASAHTQTGIIMK